MNAELRKRADLLLDIIEENYDPWKHSEVFEVSRVLLQELVARKLLVEDAMKEIEETERLYGLEGVEAIAILNYHLDKLTEEEQKP